MKKKMEMMMMEKVFGITRWKLEVLVVVVMVVTVAEKRSVYS